MPVGGRGRGTQLGPGLISWVELAGFAHKLGVGRAGERGVREGGKASGLGTWRTLRLTLTELQPNQEPGVGQVRVGEPFWAASWRFPVGIGPGGIYAPGSCQSQR